MQKKLYAVLTFVFLGIAVGLIVISRLAEPAGPASPRSSTQIAGGSLRSGLPTGEPEERGLPIDEMGDGEYATGATSVWGSNGLVLGMSSDVPSLDELPTIDEIPWSISTATSAFRRLSARRCDLLKPPSAVQPPLVRPSGERPSAVGRVPAFTIGLKVDPLAEASLPQLSGQRIKDYMAGHRLAISPPIYHSPTNGYYLGTDVRAAFYALDAPDTVAVPEQLIATAVRDLRVVGLIDSGSDSSAALDPLMGGDNSSLGRTLLLEFKFKQDDGQATSSQIELVLIHLLRSAPGQTPQLAVFATDKGRTELHELLLPPVTDVRRDPSLTGTVRFDDYKLAGLYPSKPVVTGVRLNSRRSISAELFRKTMQGGSYDETLSVSEMLDNLHEQDGSEVFSGLGDSSAASETAASDSL